MPYASKIIDPKLKGKRINFFKVLMITNSDEKLCF